MKIFKYNKRSLSFETINPVKLWTYVTIGIVVLVTIGWVSGTNRYIINKITHTTEVTDTLIVHGEKFSEEKLVELLKNCNFKYPYIVLAQAKLESGDFKSKIFKQNNNMFGMKKPRRRTTTASTEKNGYAYYRDWIDCVYDYGFYSCCNLSEVNSEEEYYAVLSDRYAEDPSYIEKLRELISREKLKKLFED
jgi:uncharacterized FlgJ-related protein